MAALFFSIALLYIRIIKVPLFTGSTQKWIFKKISNIEYIKILLGNLLGVLIISTIFYEDSVIESFNYLAVAKFNQPFIELFLKSAICGCLMTIATHYETPLGVSIICVMAFIIGGLNHCIADFFFLLMKGIINFNTLMAYVVIICGNIFGGCLVAKN